MTDAPRWVRAISFQDLRSCGSVGLVLEGVRIALFFHDGAPHAIANVCNHKGGPLAGGKRRDEFVTCPWHAWEYSVKTGCGPAPYDAESVAAYATELRGGDVWVNLVPSRPRNLLRHEPHPLARPVKREKHERTRVLGLAATAMDRDNPRYSGSDALLEHALAHAESELNAETRLIRLRDLSFRECEGNYSKAARACIWPCAITERDPADQLTDVYEGLVHWCDVVLVATPIRWGQPASLYTKMVERMNTIQNQITIANRVLIDRKVAAFIIIGGQDNIQSVAGQMLTFWSELGFTFPPFPFIAHSRGWSAEDMERNVKQLKASEALRDGAAELVARAVETARHVHADEHFSRAGRKASPEVGDPAGAASGG